MKKEYRGKFGNFVHEERKKEEETLEICEDILKNSRNEMAVAMRFLQSAFGALRPTVSGETDVMGTDGKLLFASPTWLLNTFMQNKVWINRWKCISNIYSTIVVLGFALVVVVFFVKTLICGGAC